MKDYKRLILWLDYFNSTLSRDKGRRVPIDKAVKDPTLAELIESARRLGFDPESYPARHPGRMSIVSGYISIPKRSNQKKQSLIADLTKSLSQVRGEKAVVLSQEKESKKVLGKHK